jgi:hypothetical protein
MTACYEELREEADVIAASNKKEILEHNSF